MPALSKKQQKFFGIVRAIQKGEQVDEILGITTIKNAIKNFRNNKKGGG